MFMIILYKMLLYEQNPDKLFIHEVKSKQELMEKTSRVLLLTLEIYRHL